MKIGVLLPTFRDTPDEAIETAHRAEALGIDGVFCYDHIWPIGQPERPALAPFPVLGMLASRTETVALGTLVARIGLGPPETLVDQFATLELLAPGRVIAGLGVGDRLSKQENDAYGIEFAPVETRLAEMRQCAIALHQRGTTVWIGGRHAATRDLAQALGTAANLWDAPATEVADQATRTEVTWAGPLKAAAGTDECRALLSSLREAGATWAVFAPADPLHQLESLKAATADG
jgi:alkanesulfonate monooxygenase SsuD/methylene tetrahydromethanopterin reductase-like flavin-dependent oxidoreductase (luciferase family)